MRIDQGVLKTVLGENRVLGAVLQSRLDDNEPSEKVHASATLWITTKVKDRMQKSTAAVREVTQLEAAVREVTNIIIKVVSTHIDQENTRTLRHSAKRESGPSTFSPTARTTPEEPCTSHRSARRAMCRFSYTPRA